MAISCIKAPTTMKLKHHKSCDFNSDSHAFTPWEEQTNQQAATLLWMRHEGVVSAVNVCPCGERPYHWRQLWIETNNNLESKELVQGEQYMWTKVVNLWLLFKIAVLKTLKTNNNNLAGRVIHRSRRRNSPDYQYQRWKLSHTTCIQAKHLTEIVTVDVERHNPTG